MTKEQALRVLARLGFRGPDRYLAELIPAVEMAWADGSVQANEQAMLEAYTSALVDELNREAAVKAFSLRRGLALLRGLLSRRLEPYQRYAVLQALRALAGERARSRMVEWAQAVGAVAGSPVWDARELFWLQAMRRHLEVEA